MADRLATVNRIYDAFGRRDFAEITSLIDPGIEIDYDGVVLDAAGTYRGLDGMGKLLQTILQSFDVESFDVQVEELIEAPDGRVVAALHQRGVGRGSGAQVEIRIAQAWTIDDNGVATRWEIFRDREHALEAVGMRSQPG